MRKRLLFACIIAILGVNYCHSVVYDLNSDDSITDVSSATFTDALGLADMLEPTTPPADTGYFWLKSDGAIHFKNDAGTDFDLTTGGAVGVSSIRKAGDALLTGNVTLTGGSNVTLTQVGQDISIASTGGGGASSLQVKVAGAEISSPTASIDFIGGFFTGTESPANEANISISTDALSVYLLSVQTAATTYLTLSSATATYLQLSSATLTYMSQTVPFSGDVTGLFDATVVGNDSHSHSTFTLIGFDQLLGTTDSPTFVNVIATATYAQNSDLLDGLDSTYFLPITVHNGAFFEEFHATVSVVGATIMMNIEKQNTGDLTMHFDGSITTFDTTPSSAIALTPGSDTSPQANYVYITSTTKYMEVSTSNWPTGEHIKIGYFYCQSTQTTSDAGGILINQNWNSGLKNADDNIGELLHITERLRRMGAVYFSGIAGNGTEGYLSPSVGITSFTTTAGIVYQLHSQVFPAFDTNMGDELHVKNWFGDSFHTLTNLFDITADSGGNTITNNKFFNLTFWGVQNKSDEHQTVIINLPSGFYNSQASAEEDVSGYDDFTIPREFNLESSTGFLIARVTIQMGATWTIASTTDLRGTTPQTASGGAAGTVTMFADNTFDIFDNLDDSKIIVFDAGANITTGNTRTITMADADVDLTDVGLNNTHRESDGSDHSFIDQDVTSGVAPTFAGTNITGVPAANILAGTFGGSTAYTFPEDVTVTGDLILKSAGQDYTFQGTTVLLDMQGETSGQGAGLHIFSADGDDTDSVDLSLYSRGTPGNLANRSRLRIISQPGTAAVIFTEAEGSGVLRPIDIFTEGNANQLRLATNGYVGLSVAGPAALLDVGGGSATSIDGVDDLLVKDDGQINGKLFVGEQAQSNSRNLVDQYPFLVTISTPGAASTTIGYAVSGIIPYAFTITTMTAFVNGGTNWVVNLEYRDPSTLSTDGTEIWTSDVTGTTVRIGGTFAAAGAVPAGKILYVDITSASGSPAQGCIEGLMTKDSP